MMTLFELSKLASRLYPAGIPTLPRILMAWARLDPEEELSGILENSGIDTAGAAHVLDAFLEDKEREDNELLSRCAGDRRSSPPILGIHLLMTLSASPGHRITRGLVRAGLDLEILNRRLAMKLNRDQPRFSAGEGNADGRGPFLHDHGRDLCDLAGRGRFDELCDRLEDLERIVNVLLRRRKRNVVLTGPAGVGKTALVELLSRRIVQGLVPSPLKNTRCYEVRIGSLLAGTRYRGEFEARMEKVLQTLQALQPAILFIDELHLVRGAGRGEGMVLDAANMLKTFLAGGEVRVIGSTTDEEYRKYIATDSALARRFEEIRIREPDRYQALEMLTRQAHALSEYHGIRIPTRVVEEAFDLADLHIPDRVHPDKDVDLLENAAVLAVRDGRDCVNRQDLNRALCRNRAVMHLMPAEIRSVSTRIKERIVGQDHVLRTVIDTLVPRLQGLSFPGKTLATFLFAGSEEAGKETFATALAEELFQNGRKMLRVDLSGYARSGEVNRLSGAPPGYAGSDRQGIVARWLREHGPGVLLFEKVEKAHEEVLEFLSFLLEWGCTVSDGRQEVHLSRSVVVLTTNAVAERRQAGRLRGSVPGDRRPAASPHLKAAVPGAILDRVDAVAVFRDPGASEFRELLKRKLHKMIGELEKKEIFLDEPLEPLVDALLARSNGFSNRAGAVEHLLEKVLFRPLSRALLGYQGSYPVRAGFGKDLPGGNVIPFLSGRAPVERFPCGVILTPVNEGRVVCCEA